MIRIRHRHILNTWPGANSVQACQSRFPSFPTTRVLVCCLVTVVITACGTNTTFKDMELYFDRHKDELLSAKDVFISEPDLIFRPMVDHGQS